MQIAVLGTGMVGRALSARLTDLGHTVTVGTRTPRATLARNERDAMGSPAYRIWAREHADVALATFAEAAAGAEVIVNATSGVASLAVLEATGADNLAGKVLIDVANPLNFATDGTVTLSVKDTDSLAEQIQRAYPRARVVKSLNTLTAHLMVHPDTLQETTTVFVCGDDTAAKAVTTTLLAELGHADVIDLGDLSAASSTEMLLPLWLRLMGVLGTPTFNFKIIR